MHAISIIKLNAPLAKSSVEFFSQIACLLPNDTAFHDPGSNLGQIFAFVSLHPKEFGPVTEFNKKIKLKPSTNCFALLSKPTNKFVKHDPQNYASADLYQLPYRLAMDFMMGIKMEFKYDQLFSSLLHRQHRKHPKYIGDINNDSFSVESAIEKESTECGRSVFVGSADEIGEEVTYLKRHYPRVNFYKGKDDLMSRLRGWVFQNEGTSPLPRVFTTYLESGCYSKLMEHSILRSFLRRRKWTRNAEENNQHQRVFSVDMYGNIQTIFYIFGFLLAVTFFVWVSEFIYFNRFNVVRI
ncbi:hypothetical protein Fcan01_23351 [Folsomia candida]|uniref:Uncharacterized protein n=1 Tax=Folsomia candida TaxID=158441 RepID=A0A226D958_FOLCA|nr:hypothetical protein Fcan01_23351 [Folsomia candida]